MCSGITQAELQPTDLIMRQKCVFLREALQQEKNVHHHNTEEKGCETHTGIQMLRFKGYYRVQSQPIPIYHFHLSVTKYKTLTREGGFILAGF